VLIVTPSDFSAAPPAGPTALFDWATSSNGQQITDHGQCAAALLPRDDDVVLVLPPRAVSWHRVALPKVATARLRAALEGLLEDRLLADTADLHFALEPGGRSGQTVWVAACHKVWLRGWLQILDGAARPAGRIAPALWPLMPSEAPGATPGASRSFTLDVPSNIHWAYNENGEVWLGSAGLLGVSCTPLRETPLGHGTAGDMVVTALMPPANDAPGEPGEYDVWLADPTVAGQAEQVLQQRFELVAQPAWLLRCAQSDWNLAQFDLSLSAGARRGQRLKRSFRQWRNAPAWRPARWGLAALVGVHLVGLNAAAWHERSGLDTKQKAVVQTASHAGARRAGADATRGRPTAAGHRGPVRRRPGNPARSDRPGLGRRGLAALHHRLQHGRGPFLGLAGHPGPTAGPAAVAAKQRLAGPFRWQ
jgi:general secretion pathway protein L